MRVLRVEYNGGGMYRDEDGASAWMRVIGYEGHDPQAHPMPQYDSGLGPNALGFLYNCPDVARFGFNSTDQLRRWLYRDGWINALSEYGCELVVYETTGDCYVGYTQVIFDITNAVEVQRSPLNTIL